MLLYQMVSGKVPFSKMGIGGEDLSPVQSIYNRNVEMSTLAGGKEVSYKDQVKCRLLEIILLQTSF